MAKGEAVDEHRRCQRRAADGAAPRAGHRRATRPPTRHLAAAPTTAIRHAPRMMNGGPARLGTEQVAARTFRGGWCADDTVLMCGGSEVTDRRSPEITP